MYLWWIAFRSMCEHHHLLAILDRLHYLVSLMQLKLILLVASQSCGSLFSPSEVQSELWKLIQLLRSPVQTELG